ncbi:hypothetical protein WUBG_03766, partial [Wuchereria bancrofti]
KSLQTMENFLKYLDISVGERTIQKSKLLRAIAAIYKEILSNGPCNLECDFEDISFTDDSKLSVTSRNDNSSCGSNMTQCSSDYFWLIIRSMRDKPTQYTDITTLMSRIQRSRDDSSGRSSEQLEH